MLIGNNSGILYRTDLPITAGHNWTLAYQAMSEYTIGFSVMGGFSTWANPERTVSEIYGNGEFALSSYDTAGTIIVNILLTNRHGPMRTVVCRAFSATERSIACSGGLDMMSCTTQHVTNTTSHAGMTLAWDRFNIGGYAGNGSFQSPLKSSQRVQNFVVFRRALTLNESLKLAEGIHPAEIDADSIAAFYSLDGHAVDEVTGQALTQQGTVLLSRNMGRGFRSLRPLFLVGGTDLTGAVSPTITSTSDSDTLIDESTFTVNGTNLGSASSVLFSQTGRPDYEAVSLITDNQSASIELTGLDVQDMGMAYGAATVSVTTAGGTSAAFPITISPAAGIQYVTLAGHVSGDGWAAGLASADGDQLTAPETVASSTVVLDPDGNISFTPELASSTLVARQWYDDSTDTWYEDEVQIDGGSDDDFFLFRRHRYLAAQRLVVGRIR